MARRYLKVIQILLSHSVLLVWETRELPPHFCGQDKSSLRRRQSAHHHHCLEPFQCRFEMKVSVVGLMLMPEPSQLCDSNPGIFSKLFQWQLDPAFSSIIYNYTIV